MIDVAKNASERRWIYAATEAMKLVYKTFEDKGLLPEEADIAVAVIDRMDEWIQTGSNRSLREFYDQVVGTRKERGLIDPYRPRQVTVTMRRYIDDRVSIAKNNDDELTSAFWYIFVQFTHEYFYYSSRWVLEKAVWILQNPQIGYTQKIPGVRAREGEAMIMAILARAMTVP